MKIYIKVFFFFFFFTVHYFDPLTCNKNNWECLEYCAQTFGRMMKIWVLEHHLFPCHNRINATYNQRLLESNNAWDIIGGKLYMFSNINNPLKSARSNCHFMTLAIYDPYQGRNQNICG